MAKTDETSEEIEEKPKKSGRKGLVFGLLGAVLAGGVGFAVTFLGFADSLLEGGHDKGHGVAKSSIAFVPLEPMVISLGPSASARHLRFTGQLEVSPDAKEKVTTLQPRIVDALNTYLRAVDEAELSEPSAMVRLRAQMLRRVQVVIGDDLVRDLLIMEFVLN